MHFKQTVEKLDQMLHISDSFDLIRRPLKIGGTSAMLYMVDGFVKDDILEKIMEFLMKLSPADLEGVSSAQAFADLFVSYVEVDCSDDFEQTVTVVLSGTIALVSECFRGAILIDARTYPVRGLSEPEDDKVLRGSHDGFVETLVFNTALIRRRIRDPRLTMEIYTVGRSSKTDVVIAYMKERVNLQVLKRIQNIIQNLNVNALTMGQQSLNEALMKKGWYNPFPKVRYSERPDATAAAIQEGKVAILVDNSPTALLLPVTIFDFVQESNDYYFPPLIGTYLRIVRSIIFILTIFLTPVWYLLIKNPEAIPPWLQFINVSEPGALPIWLQLIIFEFAIDGLKLASLNTPSALSNSFSVLGALILGEFAVQAHWFVPEVLLYMGFVAVGNFTQPSFELGYAFKIMRIMLIILVALFDVWGFVAGILIMAALIAFNRTAAGTSYIYPIIPFNGRQLLNQFVRLRMNKTNS